ncbi:hypothetical protein TrVE_jg13511 [Triparma verrucosa]|uniref:Uncharacterized protein n=1 Tax=Triparma verrucosa TaxID=1606542 RepID=A0A9W7F7J6_9STRA|nr:hypothetical protein TrVE_jg13511 [Triparma verrucosa]
MFALRHFTLLALTLTTSFASSSPASSVHTTRDPTTQVPRQLPFTPTSGSISGGPTCPQMNPFCPNDGTSYDFFLAGCTDPNCPTTIGGNFGCLASHPGEQWLYISIASAGNMVFETTSNSDHDYAVWGPYSSKQDAIAACPSLPAPVDCSFDPRADETITVNNVQVAQVYIMLIANYAKVDQPLSAVTSASNTAGYDCQAVIDFGSPTPSPTVSPTPAPTRSPVTSYPTLSPTLPPPPKNESRCECWYKADVVACPIVRYFNDYECGGGSGIYNYECTETEQVEEDKQYILWNVLPFVYKIVFLSSLRLLLGCTLADFGETTIICFRAGNAFWMLLVGNIVLLLAIYLSRCFFPLWAFFMFVWLHFDCILCIVNRVLDAKPKAKPKPAPPRSNLELFAYTNHKRSWKDKAYATFELQKHKKDAKIAKKIEKKNAKGLKNLRKPSYRGGAL